MVRWTREGVQSLGNSSHYLITLAVTVPIKSPGSVLISFERWQSSPQNFKMVSNRPPG